MSRDAQSIHQLFPIAMLVGQLKHCNLATKLKTAITQRRGKQVQCSATNEIPIGGFASRSSSLEGFLSFLEGCEGTRLEECIPSVQPVFCRSRTWPVAASIDLWRLILPSINQGDADKTFQTASTILMEHDSVDENGTGIDWSWHQRIFGARRHQRASREAL